MKLHYFQGPNFGDQLSPWIFSRLIGDLLDGDQHCRFFGIGTILNNFAPRATMTVVFGSGVGYGGSPPTLDGTWKIYCLRGPLSARSLDLAPDYAVTDPAALVCRLFPRTGGAPAHRFSYMPHWNNSGQEWEEICNRIGFGYIDPRAPVETVLSNLDRTECLIAEAMHGAIVADAFRIPWIAVEDRSNPDCLPFKWHDWCASVKVDYDPITMPHLPKQHPAGGGASDVWASNNAALEATLREIARKGRPQLCGSSLADSLLARLDGLLDAFRADVQSGRFERQQPWPTQGHTDPGVGP